MFWDDLIGKGQPIIGLAPMDGVTDAVMRYMSARYSAPDVMFSEFVSVDALHHAASSRRDRLLKTFIKASEVGPLTKRPFEVAQVFGSKPDYFAEAAELIEKLGFDGVDINMGCPAHKVEEQGSGAGLIWRPEVARAIIRTVKEATGLPVSVKTRIGVDRDVSEEWMEILMEEKPAMISLHGRTLRQLYQGEADWEAIERAGRVVHRHGGFILGNGDIGSVEEGRRRVEQYGLDGFLIGRAAEGNPAVFGGGEEPTKNQRMTWIREHTGLHTRIFGPDQFMPLRKHLAWYARGFPGAAELRVKLVQTDSREEVERIVAEAV